MASEYLKWKYRDVQPFTPVELTEKQRRQNWWYYHKWYVGIAVAIVLVVAYMIWSVLSQVHPDYQFAYVGSVSLSEEEETAWQERLVGLGMDCNGDGKVIVQFTQYLIGENNGNAMYDYAFSLKLMANLESNESYFFLLEDPEAFQENYEVLQEDWIPLENGLFLARRDFWEHRTPEDMADCDRLWEVLKQEKNLP